MQRALRLERRAILLACAGQVVIWVRSPKPNGAYDHALQAVVTALPVLYAALAWLAPPAAYRRHRLWLLSVARLIAMALPSTRSATSAAGGLMMGRAPLPGLLGAAADFVRLLLGTRLLSNCIITLVFRMSLPLAAATHTAVVLLTRNNQEYCETELLAAPLARQRIAAVEATLDTFMLLLPQGPALAVAASTKDHGGEQACALALNFLQAGCVAVPLLLLAVWEADEAPAEDEQGGSQPGGRLHWLPRRLKAPWNAAVAAAAAAAAELRQRTASELAALLWVGTALTWLFVKAAAA